MCKKTNKDMLITMPEFLYNYLGIEDINIFKITHEDIKILFPKVKRSSFEKIEKDYTSIYNGDVILVKDKKGKTLPYYNPLRYLDIEFDDMEMIKKPVLDKEENRKVDIESLTNYELKKEYIKDKKQHKYALCRVLKKEITERGIKSSGKKRKMIEKYEGEIDYD